MQAAAMPHPWRRFLRFSMRGLILFVIVFGAGLGWIVRQAHIQRDAVAAIKRDDGVVYYDSGWTDGPTYLTVIAPIDREPWVPKWLVSPIGIDYFSQVTPVRLDGTQITDAGLAHLKVLTNLSGLRLRRTQITDAGLVHLKGLTKLSDLRLKTTQVTDAGVDERKRSLPSLTIRR
jgi:hypothetical protein